MGEEHVKNDEVEDGSMYITIDSTEDCDYITEDEDDDKSSEYERGPLDRQENF